GCRLDPLPGDEQLGVRMPDEHVGPDPLVQLRRGHVVAHVGVADARRDSQRATAGGEQRRLADAEAAPRAEHAARAKVRWINEIDVRVVRDAVAHRGIEALDFVDLAARAGDRVARECGDGGRIAVDEAGGSEVLVHGSRLTSPSGRASYSMKETT